MYPLIEAIEVRFCIKCGAVSNSSDVTKCKFCQSPLRKLAKIAQHCKEPISTNKGINYLEVLKTFNPVNRDSKYSERTSSNPSTGNESHTSFGHGSGGRGVGLIRSKNVDFSVSSFKNLDENTNSYEEKQQYSTVPARPKITRATSNLVMSNNDVNLRGPLNRSMSSREFSLESSRVRHEDEDAIVSPTMLEIDSNHSPTESPPIISSPIISSPIISSPIISSPIISSPIISSPIISSHSTDSNPECLDAVEVDLPLLDISRNDSPSVSSLPNAPENQESPIPWGSRLPDRNCIIGNLHATNVAQHMAMHRHDSSRSIAPSGSSPHSHSHVDVYPSGDIQGPPQNDLYTRPHETSMLHVPPDHRRSRLAKTGHFYIRGAKPHSPDASGVYISEWLETIISAHSPRVSPTENMRVKSGIINDPFPVPQPWIPTLEVGDRDTAVASLSELSISSPTLFQGQGQRLADPPPMSPSEVQRHPYLSADAPRWCKVVNELFSTEFEYSRDLELLIFARETFTESADLDEIRDAIDSIFANLAELSTHVHELYSTLTQTFQGVNSLESQLTPYNCVNHICGTFVGMADGFNLYVDYCIAYNKGTSLAHKLSQTNTNFRDQLRKIEQNPKYKNTPLSSYLYKPVQRIFKYPLLFKELMKHLPNEPELTSNLQKTIDMIESVLSTINEAKRAEEKIKALLRVKTELIKLGVVDFEVSAPHRIFLKEGCIDAVDATAFRPPKTFKNTKTWRYFLFNDVFVCARKSIRKTSKLVIPLHEAIVLDISDNAFQVVHIRNKIFIFVASLPSEKKALFEALESAIRKSTSRDVDANTKKEDTQM